MGIKRIDQLDEETNPLISGLVATRKPASGDGPAKRTTWEKIKDLFRPYWKTDIQNAEAQSATASGTDVYTATISPAPLAYITNQVFIITFTNANTGASTININGLGAKSIKDQFGNDLSPGAIASGSHHVLMYDGTNFQIVVSGASAMVITSGVYQPALTGVSNITSVTANSCTFMRIGDIVHVAGMIDISIGGVGAYAVRVSVPHGSDFTQDYDCCGVVGGPDTSDHTGYIKADTTNDEALLIGEDGGGEKYFTFQYIIKL